MTYKKLKSISSWAVFAIATTVYYFSAQRTGSLWDCGEFISGAEKLEVVHPPGAPLFLLVGRIFTLIAKMFSDNPEMVSFSVNMLSGLATAFAAMLVALITIEFSKFIYVGRDETPDDGTSIAITGAGFIAGLVTAFSTSNWFSAVEGEVYATSTLFTVLTVWAMVKWYSLPDSRKTDRWMVFAIYAGALSTGVHLLSLLTYPMLALLYYFKKYEKTTIKGILISLFVGLAALIAVLKGVIVGIPTLWGSMERMMVNSFGAPFHTGIIPLIILLVAVVYFGLKYAHKKKNVLLELLVVGFALSVIGFSTIGMVVIRANTVTPINMSSPTDPMRLMPYINREQYGSRALLKGPDFTAKPQKTAREDRYGRVGDRYEITDQALSYVYKPRDKKIFPRMGHGDQGRPTQYKIWMGLDPNKALPRGRPNLGDNVAFFWNYQIKWMYWRYFMWNFSGRQNGTQGYYPWDKKRGNWISGIGFIDNLRGIDEAEMPDFMTSNKGKNKYYMIPFFLGLLGLFFHLKNRKREFLALLILFLITGLGLIVYNNQPPNEPRERDYVLVGSFITFSIWVGMGVLGLFTLFKDKFNMPSKSAAFLGLALALTAPLLMGVQNFDDHSRRFIKASRDYASNFLNSCRPNSIIFTYGDNDTYPLWYAQEVEGIRTDVRVVNLSLIQVDWYINLLRYRMNDAAPVKMTLTKEQITGRKRTQVPVDNGRLGLPNAYKDKAIPLKRALQFVGEDHPLNADIQSYFPTPNVYIPVEYEKGVKNGIIDPADTSVVDKIPLNLGGKQFLMKGDIAILDIIANNIWERPIYFAVTTQQAAMKGLGDYCELEGLGLRLVPFKTKGQTDVFGIIGNGRVNTEKSYDAIMNKFKWGNFDKYDLFVNRSYLASVHAHRGIISRTADALIRKGDKKKAADLINKYFEGFPNMNFPFDEATFGMIVMLVNADDCGSAKDHIRILADNTIQKMSYFSTLDEESMEGYESDARASVAIMRQLQQVVRNCNDDVFTAELTELFRPFEQQIQAPK